MILIVDDKQENLFSLKTLLQLNLYEVETANSGEEALKKILKKEYAIIILDVQMPGMDGYEVAETITGYSKTRYIPIIFLSAVNIDKRFITKGYASGGVDYVTKPFDPDLLLLKVKTFQKLYEQNRELNLIQGTLKEEIETRKKAQNDLEESNTRLEEKVMQRTKELSEKNNELELSNKELQQYASLASHDLQEPLRKIITFSQLVQDRYLEGTSEASLYLKKIVASAERMKNLINDLLKYSNLSATSVYIHNSLNNIVHDVISDLELAIKDRNAVVTVGDLPSVDMVEGRIRQVFQNIISNALKFSKKNEVPQVNIMGETIKEKSFASIAVQDGGFARITIADNGIGFNEMYLEKIFTIFQRLHKREDYEGTGIGLAIVKKIIEQHNGLLTATSKEGGGTTFIIILPVHQNTAS
jgi:signal transduction histidine kinase